jgi:parallel beta-helix repeat protein
MAREFLDAKGKVKVFETTVLSASEIVVALSTAAIIMVIVLITGGLIAAAIIIMTTPVGAARTEIVQPSPRSYQVRLDGTGIIATNSTGQVVFSVSQDHSTDIIQAIHDRIRAENGQKGGIINIDSGTYTIHKPMKFSVPIILNMQNDTVLRFAPQTSGSISILTTYANVTIQGGIFDCNSAEQTDGYIHGLFIDKGSENSTITGVEARDCTGNGFVMLADYSTISKSLAQDNNGNGIYVKNCNFCVVKDSAFINNIGNGIGVSQQDGQLHGYNTVINNIASYNSKSGISIDGVSNNLIKNNIVQHNLRGISIWHSTGNSYNNEISGNAIGYSTINGIWEQGPAPDYNDFLCDYSSIHDNKIVFNNSSTTIVTAGQNTKVENNDH